VQNGIIAKAGPAASPPHLHPLAVAEQCAYTKPEDWVFASKQYGGRRPYGEHPDLAQVYSSCCAASRISEAIRVAHIPPLYSALLRSVGTEFKVMQESPDALRLHLLNY
jgi:hypothetical protein